MTKNIDEISDELLEEAQKIAYVGKNLTLTSCMLRAAGGREISLVFATQTGNLAAELIGIYDTIIAVAWDLKAGG